MVPLAEAPGSQTWPGTVCPEELVLWASRNPLAPTPPPCWLPCFQFYLFFLSLFLVFNEWELDGFVEVNVRSGFRYGGTGQGS